MRRREVVSSYVPTLIYLHNAAYAYFFACATFNPARSSFLSYTPSLAVLLFLLDFTFKSKLCYTLLHLQLSLSLSPLPFRTGHIYLFVCLLLFLPHATAICIILRVCVCVCRDNKTNPI